MTQKEECLRLMGTPINDSCKVDYIELVRVGVDCEKDLNGKLYDPLKEFREEEPTIFNQACKFPLDKVEYLKSKQPKIEKVFDNELDQVAWESLYEQAQIYRIREKTITPEDKLRAEMLKQKVTKIPIAEVITGIKEENGQTFLQAKPLFLEEEDINQLFKVMDDFMFRQNAQERMSKKLFAVWPNDLDKKQKAMINYRIRKIFEPPGSKR